MAITLRDGRRLERRVDQAKGQPKNPLSDAELTAKFRDCAARVLAPERVDAVLRAVEGLPTVPDVSAVARLLGG